MPNKWAAASRDRGFTLLEVLVAFIITALALSALFSASLTALSSLRNAAGYEGAVARARSLLALGAVALIPGERTGTDRGGYRWRVLVRPVDSVRTSDGPDELREATFVLYEVDVEIGWGDGQQARHLGLTTERLRVTHGSGT